MKTSFFFLILLICACSGREQNDKDTTARTPKKLPIFYSYDSVDPKGDSVYLVIPPHKLITHTGDSFAIDQVKGKVVVADFFFSRCKNICPMMSSQLSRVQRYFLDNNEVRIISYSIDPENDSVPVLATYAQQYGTDKNRWLLLTGGKKTIYDVARTGYRLAVAPGDGGPGDFIHSEQLVLLDPKMRIRGYYDGTDSVSVDLMIGDMNLLLEEFSKK
ncbi:MAG: electron transport protein SCO1/SenC [Bacteroidetes bacterium]|nr:MAG: electron transport protein SCO1/SenC [Bacteroidota bacterium]